MKNLIILSAFCFFLLVGCQQSVDDLVVNENYPISIEASIGDADGSRYIGNTPNIEFIKFDLETKDGYILVDEDMKTSLDNVYAIGDVRSKKIRQIVTAVNDGAIAALAIEKEMKKA